MHKGHIRIHHNCSHSRSTYSYTRRQMIIIFFYCRSMNKSHRDMLYYLYLCTIPNNRKIRNPTTPNQVRLTPFWLQDYWSASLNLPNTKIAMKRQFVHVFINHLWRDKIDTFNRLFWWENSREPSTHNPPNTSRVSSKFTYFNEGHICAETCRVPLRQHRIFAPLVLDCSWSTLIYYWVLCSSLTELYT